MNFKERYDFLRKTIKLSVILSLYYAFRYEIKVEE